MNRKFNFKHAMMAILLGLLTYTAAPAGAQPVLGEEEGYNVEINKGQLIRLNAPASSVIVADPAIADVQVVSPRLIYVNGRRTGETSIFAVDKQDGEILNATVTVTHNLSKLNKSLKHAMPGADVHFETVDGALVLAGYTDSPIEADDVRRLAEPFLQPNERLVNMIRTAGADQVMLKVKVAEVSRNELKRFGIHLESILNSGSNFVFGLAQGRDILDAGSILRNGDDNSIFASYNSGDANVNAVIDALANDGLVTVLAEPNLTAMSGKNANFLAGGEFPIPVVGQDGQVTIEYRPFGVSLAFTPQVLSKEKISLSVAPEVSTLSQIGAVEIQGFNIPSLITRRANTTVELGSGQTFAIAGLLRNDTGNDISKFPWLGDIPILGALFRSSEFRHDETELVILVTPYIVSGNTATAANTPLDQYQPAGDLGRVLFGKLYEESPRKPVRENSRPVAAKDEEHAAVEGESPATDSASNNDAEIAMGSEQPTLRGPGGYILK